MKTALFVTCLVWLIPLTLVHANTLADPEAQGYLTINNDDIHYEIWGEGFPLILVSGGSGMDVRQWDRVTPTLMRSFKVIRYDPRGMGKSDNPTARYTDTDDLKKLMDHLQIERAGLMGLSIAGGLVLEFAMLHPNRVAGVVAAAPFIPGFEFSDSMQVRLTGFNNAVVDGREAFLDAMLKDDHFIPAPLDRSVRDFARSVMAFNFDKGADFNPKFVIPPSVPLIENASKISSPVLLLAGELDHADIRVRNKFLVSQISLAHERVIAHAGHNSPLENPGAFLNAIKGFLLNISSKLSV